MSLRGVLTVGDTPLTLGVPEEEAVEIAAVKSGPLIAVAATTGLLGAIAAAGGNAGRILSTLGVAPSVFANPDGFIASSMFARVLEEASRATADECFGLHFGETFNPKDIGSLVYVVVNSPTVAAAMQSIERYLHIHNEAAIASFGMEGGQGYLRFRVADLPIDSRRQHTEYSMTVVRNTFRIIAGSHWTPREVQFAHETPTCTAEHTRVFGSPVLFGCAANALVVEHDFLEREVPAADPRLYRLLKEHAERTLSEMPRADDVLAAVRRAIADAMLEGDPKLERVVSKLSMSARTLERRLKEHGVAFKKLVDDTRRRFALAYLRERNKTLTEIAFLLGYSEVSAFNRAFKRWTGATPLQYRKSPSGHGNT